MSPQCFIYLEINLVFQNTRNILMDETNNLLDVALNANLIPSELREIMSYAAQI